MVATNSRLALLSVAAAMAMASANADDYFTGDGTAYTLGSLSSGNCNMMMSGFASASTNYAAINAEQWNSLGNCGRCAEVSCDDANCADTSTSVVVQILDQCPECKYGDLDLSPSVFKTITGSDPARYSIKWKFVDCPVSGNLNYCLKGGSNAYWTAVQPANFVTGVASMTINGAATTMLGSAYYYLLDGASTKQTDLSAVTISVTDVNGKTITDTVSLTDSSCTEGSSQFASGGSSGTSTYTQTKSSTPTPTTAAPTSAPVTTTSAPVTTTSAPAPTTSAPTSAPATSAPSTYSPESVSPATTAPAYTPAPETVSPDLYVSTSTPTPVTSAPESTFNFDSADQSDASDNEADASVNAGVNAGVNVTTSSTPTPTTSKPATTTKAPSTSTTSVSADSDTQQQSTTTETPTSTPSSEAQQQPTSSSSGSAEEANTKASGGTGSSAVIGSIAAAACAVVVAAVAVAVIQKKKKALNERKAGEEDAELASSHLRMRSFDLQRMSTPANQQNVATMQSEPHRSDFAIL